MAYTDVVFSTSEEAHICRFPFKIKDQLGVFSNSQYTWIGSGSKSLLTQPREKRQTQTTQDLVEADPHRRIVDCIATRAFCCPAVFQMFHLNLGRVSTEALDLLLKMEL